MNMWPYMEKLELSTYMEVCLNCLAYAFDQVQTSHVDVLLETREKNLKLIAQVYMELSTMCPMTTYRFLSRRDIEEALKGEA